MLANKFYSFIYIIYLFVNVSVNVLGINCPVATGGPSRPPSWIRKIFASVRGVAYPATAFQLVLFHA